jgi:hypothetical protein
MNHGVLRELAKQLRAILGVEKTMLTHNRVGTGVCELMQ